MFTHALSIASLFFATPAFHSTTRAQPALCEESVEALVRKGQTALELGNAEEARALFERAAKLDGDKLRTRVWVLRADIALGKIEDTLALLDEEKQAGAKGPDIDYAYGIAFWALSKQQVANANTNMFTDQQFADAARMLASATTADADRYRDAFFALAESAWYAQQLDSARKAADRLVQNEPKRADAHLLRGKIAFSQFVATKDDAAQTSASEAAWKAAVESFERAANEFATRGELAARSGAADARMQLGNAQLWKDAKVEAAKAYGAALLADPSAVDFSQIQRGLGGEAFLATLEEAAKGFQPPPGDSARESTLQWWLGWARFEQRDYAGAEKAFVAAVTKTPAFLNSWYYVFRCQYSQQEYAKALETLREYRDRDAESLGQALAMDAQFNLSAIEYLIGWCVNPEKHEGDLLNLDAALLCEVCTLVAPEDARHWNNLGLFVRDHGDELKRKSTTSKEELGKLWERAFAAYSRALELEPENPGFLNDTAVMLHYYLERDYPQAKELYERAAKNAEAELAKPDLDASKREWFQTALRDAHNNLELLRKKIEKGN